MLRARLAAVPRHRRLRVTAWVLVAVVWAVAWWMLGPVGGWTRAGVEVLLLTAGGVYYSLMAAADQAAATPYRWACPEDDCGVRISASDPVDTANYASVHQRSHARGGEGDVFGL